MGCLHDPANVQQTSSKCIQNKRANAGRLLDRVNTLLRTPVQCRTGVSGTSRSTSDCVEGSVCCALAFLLLVSDRWVPPALTLRWDRWVRDSSFLYDKLSRRNDWFSDHEHWVRRRKMRPIYAWNLGQLVVDCPHIFTIAHLTTLLIVSRLLATSTDCRTWLLPASQCHGGLANGLSASRACPTHLLPSGSLSVWMSARVVR